MLVSPPGRSLLDVRAAQLQDRYGPEAAEALRSTVAGLLATRTLPPLDAMGTEIRPLLPAAEVGFLAELDGLDPALEAARVRARSLIVAPANPAPYDPAAWPPRSPGGAEVLVSGRSGSTLSPARRPPRTRRTGRPDARPRRRAGPGIHRARHRGDRTAHPFLAT